MNFLLNESLLYYLVAGLFGGLIGWVLRGVSARRRIKRLEEDWSRDEERADAAAKQRSERAIQAVNVKRIAVEPAGREGESSYDLSEISGIGDSIVIKLHELDIHTTADLIDRCAKVDALHSLSDATQLEDFVLRRWAATADLLRIPGVLGSEADVLSFTGVTSVQDLARRDPEKLRNKLLNVYQRGERSGSAPTKPALKSWIEFSKSMEFKLSD